MVCQPKFLHLHGIYMYIFNNISYSNNLWLYNPSLWNKIHNFETSHPHDTIFIKCLFLNLIVLYKPLLIEFHITDDIKMPLFYLLHECFWWICIVGTMFTFSTTPTKNSKIASSKMKLFCFIISTSIQSILCLLNSILIFLGQIYNLIS